MGEPGETRFPLNELAEKLSRSPRRETEQRTWIRLCLYCLVAGLFFLLHSLYYNFWLIDDPFISYKYAQNLAHGNGLVFNLGEPIEGYSNFLYVCFLSQGIKMGADPTWLSPGLGLLFMLHLVLGLGISGGLKVFKVNSGQMTGIQDAGIPQKVGVMAGILIATSLPASYWAISGMETGFYTLLLFLAYVLSASCLQKNSPAKNNVVIWCAVTLLLCVALTRVEGTMFSAPVLALLCYRWRNLNAGERRHWMLSLATMLLLFAIYHAWRYFYFGDLVPSTVRAKVGGSVLANLKNGATYVLWGGFVEALPITLFLLLYPWAKRMRGLSPTPIEGLCLGALALQCLFILMVGGDWMPYSRFLVPVLPFAAILAAFAYRDISSQIAVRTGNDSGLGRDLFPFLLIATIAISLTSEVVRTRPLVRESRRNEIVQPILDLGHWMSQNLPADSVIALEEAGYIPYFTDFNFLEFYGLVTPEVARQKGAHFEKDGADWLLAQKPDYFLLLAGRSEAPGEYPLSHFYPGSAGIVRRTDFHRWYRPIKVVRRGAHSPYTTDMLLYERLKMPNEAGEVPDRLRTGGVKIEVAEDE